MTPRFVIVVGTYQFAPFLNMCLETLVSQTLRPARIIVCDDCSSDNSWDILQGWQNSYPDLIEIYKTPQRMGAIGNGAYLYSLQGQQSFDFITHIDGDDHWHPQKLELEYAAIKACPGAEFAFSDVALTDAQNKTVGFWQKQNEIPSHGGLFPFVLGRKYFYKTHSMFRNELISWRAHMEEGHVNKKLLNFWDWERKIRLANKYKGAHSGETLVYYRQHPGGISKTFGQDNLLEAMIQVYEKHLPILSSRSLYDQLFVQISFETLAAKQRKQLGLSGHEKYSYPNVAQRISKLFTKLSAEELVELKTIFSKEIQELFMGAQQSNMAIIQHAVSPPDIRNNRLLARTSHTNNSIHY
ncbi:MAG: glycosyltransferase [Desulfobulbaceae bacterium]|nr:glycosyltransferase [Desulfobulbaceae bacterium]